LLEGGEHNDQIYGGTEADTLRGDEGNDHLRGDAGNDSLEGGAGNDSLYGNADGDTLLGGDGDDYLHDYEGANSQDGGAGDDSFDYVSYGNAVDTLTGGAGRDSYRIRSDFTASEAADRITDFAVGPDGDYIDVTDLRQNMTGLAIGANPFTTGHLRLIDDAGDKVLQYNKDGAGPTGCPCCASPARPAPPLPPRTSTTRATIITIRSVSVSRSRRRPMPIGSTVFRRRHD
jgi:Ca2+-binding RTX toxin-like protein